MILTILGDSRVINDLLRHPSIFPAISDGCDITPDGFHAPLDSNYLYIGGYVEDALIGIMVYHISSNDIECHIQVLPEYRKQHAEEFARQALDIFRGGKKRVIAKIPEKFQNVIRFAKKVGFEEITTINGVCSMRLK
jgi:hypothetical protein